MPIGFSDILKTTAQINNSLTKGIVSTDDTYGGVRSKIDDWTDLHTSTYNGGSGYTFQDEGTGAAPGHFKAYSTMFYVADGRALIETASASGAIRLDSNGEYVTAGGQLYTHDPSGTPEPEYWVLIDPTQIGGTGTGTDKLPKFTITGTQGSNSTAIPAGYQKLNVVTQAASTVDGFTALVLEDELGDTLNIANGGTLKIAGANAVSTDIVNFGGTQSLVITVPDATSTNSGLVQLFDDAVQNEAANSVSTTANRTYGVQFNSADQLVVNVPWTSNSGTVTQVTSATQATLTVANTTSTPALSIVTGAVANNAVTLATGDQIHAFVTSYADVAGTDNSTDVTLASVTNNYLTLSGQEITAGTVPVTLGGTGLTTIAAGSLLQASSANTISALTGGVGEDGYLLSYDHSTTSFELVAATATANDVEIQFSGTGITFGSSFTTNQSSGETITVTLDQQLQDIAGLNSAGLLTTDGINITLDTNTYLVAGDISSLLDNIDVAEGVNTTTYNVLMTSASAGSSFTGTFIDTDDLKFTPSSLNERGKLETGDLLVKGNLTVLGAGTEINLQRENVIVKDANMVLGATTNAGGTITGQTSGNVGVTAYIDGADDPFIQYNKNAEYWEVKNRTTSTAPTLKVAQVYTSVVTLSADTSEQITHNMNNWGVVVQVQDANNEIVYCRYDVLSVNTVVIYFQAAVTGDFRFTIIG